MGYRRHGGKRIYFALAIAFLHASATRKAPLPASLRQIEAFYWTARLGGFTDAARRLHLAQSTVSKRVIELESTLGATLFDRAAPTLRLTRAGESTLPIASQMLVLEQNLREAAGGPETFAGLFRFGVTELVALTWLPRLIMAIKRDFPDLVPAPEVAASAELYAKLNDDALDLVVGLDPPQTSAVALTPLDDVRLEWVCAPGFGPRRKTIRLEELAKDPILTQGQGSGLQRLVLGWAASNGLPVTRVAQCNSLNVLAGLAAAGLGVTFLTANPFAPELPAGQFRVTLPPPPIPPIRYYAVRRRNELSPLPGRIAALAQACCDFTARSLAR